MSSIHSIIGRVIRINYRGANENDALAVDVDKLHNELLPLVQRNKVGSLINTWFARYGARVTRSGVAARNSRTIANIHNYFCVRSMELKAERGYL